MNELKNNPDEGLFFVLEFAGFVDDAREFVDDVLAVDRARIGNADEGKVSAAEEFLHIFGVAAGGFVGITMGAVVDLNGADGAHSGFITENEVNVFVFDKTIGFIAILGADLMAQ